MKIYKVEQDVNNGYDTYDAMIVCAKNPDDARKVTIEKAIGLYSKVWAPYESLIVTEIGTPKRGIKRGLILASFNAG